MSKRAPLRTKNFRTARPELGAREPSLISPVFRILVEICSQAPSFNKAKQHSRQTRPLSL